jgi:hypothetical protein
MMMTAGLSILLFAAAGVAAGQNGTVRPDAVPLKIQWSGPKLSD